MIQLFSPAKINLFLRVVSKRQDGFHNLSSVLQTISLGDFISIQIHPDQSCSQDLLTCTDPSLPIDSSNLVLKATNLFRKKTGIKTVFKIHLEKNIPCQAGLGGGSSNAATTLWACNQLTHSQVADETLGDWSAEIGSDIPFFFSLGTAHCTGRGEFVQQVPMPTLSQICIIKPHKISLSTPEVFKNFKFESALDEGNAKHDLNNFLSSSSTYFNDLEKTACSLKPELNQIKNNIQECGFKTVMMTGTGSAFVCLGNGTPPSSQNFDSFQVRPICRAPSTWYQHP